MPPRGVQKATISLAILTPAATLRRAARRSLRVFSADRSSGGRWHFRCCVFHGRIYATTSLHVRWTAFSAQDGPTAVHWLLRRGTPAMCDGRARAGMRTGIRLLVVAVTLGLATGIACAQPPTGVPRIGILGLDRPPLSPEFLQSLRELGYVEGQNVVLEPRFHHGNDQMLPSLAVELVRLRVNVIVALSGVAIRAAMQATSNVPIVGVFVGDQGARKFVPNLERPDGNVTGIYLLTAAFGGKWLELIKEAVPNIRRVAVLWPRNAEDEMPVWDEVRRAARVLGTELVSVNIEGSSTLRK